MDLYWKVIGLAVLLMAAFAVYLALCGSLLAVIVDGTSLDLYVKRLVLSHSLVASIPAMVVAGVGYLALVLGFNVVMRVYLLRDVWARVVASTQLHDIEALANVSARGELANALGEGFADGLDVAGF